MTSVASARQRREHVRPRRASSARPARREREAERSRASAGDTRPSGSGRERVRRISASVSRSYDLVQHGGAAGDERRAADGLRPSAPASGAARRAEVVPGRARRDDQEVQARLGERDVVGERRRAAPPTAERDRRDVDAARPSRARLHARAPLERARLRPDAARRRCGSAQCAGRLRPIVARTARASSAASAPATSSAPARRRRRAALLIHDVAPRSAPSARRA